MSILLHNALLVDLDPPDVQPGALRIEDGRITERAATLRPVPDDEAIDCGGALVLPGLVNGHTHLYSALAIGMPPPEQAPRNFPEILEYVWWRLDRALDLASIETSARVGALHALRHGTTTLIDHHASPNAIDGALDAVERGIAEVGLRGVLCYETTDRHGPDGSRAGLAENRRYLQQVRRQGGGRFAGLVGAHASFTLEDGTLRDLADLAREIGTGVHIHVAEDPCDQQDALRRGAPSLVRRLADHGILQPDSILAHCTHLDAESIELVRGHGCAVAHNPRSNMNNAVGYAPTTALLDRLQLGTDGIGGDLLAEARAAWFIGRHAGAAFSPQEVLAMLARAARRASRALGVTLGRLEPEAAADIVITDYIPPTPLDAGNLAGHAIFGLDAVHVRDVLVAGRWQLRDRAPLGLDPAATSAAAAETARDLWRRMRQQ